MRIDVMRVPLPPSPFLADDGRMAATCQGDAVSFVTVSDGDVQTIALPHDAGLLAFAPGGRLAVAGSEHLSVLHSGPPYPVLATVEIPAPLFRFAIRDQAVTGVARFSDRETRLCVWRGPDLAEAHPDGGYALGPFAPFFLGPLHDQGRVLLAGRFGVGAFGGGGERMCVLAEPTDGELEHVWRGEDLPFTPDGYVVPQRHDRIAVHSRTELALLKLAPAQEPAIEVLWRQTFEELEKVVLSPDATWVAWMSGGGPGAPVRVRSVGVGEAEPRDHGAVDLDGMFPALAIDDRSEITLVCGSQPDRIRVFRSSVGRMRHAFDVRVPREP